jgi:predicted nucleic acid-binding protein
MRGQRVRQPRDRATTLERVLTSGFHRRAGDESYRRAVTIAHELGWSTYDAEGIALAEIERAPVVTLDARLRRGAEPRVEVIELGGVLR